MAEDVLQFEICAPQRNPLQYEATEVILPGIEGVFTVQPGHTPFLSPLGIGVLEVLRTDGEDDFFAISGGFAEVLDNRVVVLADTAERYDEIDEARAKEAEQRAETRLSKRPDEDGEQVDRPRAESALERAAARLLARSRQGY